MMPMGALGSLTDAGDLDRNSGEGPAGRAGPGGDVVGRCHRIAPGPGPPTAPGWSWRRTTWRWAPAGVLDREQGRQQLLACAGASPGHRHPAALSAIVERDGGDRAQSTYQDTIVRPNLPDQTEATESAGPDAEGLVGNRQMTVRVDGRGATYDVYFPTVGLHSFVRPARGTIRGAVRTSARSSAAWPCRRLDWFTERGAWDSFQQYQGATNLLTTKLNWRYGPIQALMTDFVAMGESLPLNAGREKSPGQYLKRFFLKNDGDEPERPSSGSMSRRRSTAASATWD